MKAGSKFEKGGDKLKSIHVPLETWTQLGIDLITNLPETAEGYNTIITCIDYTSKFVESKPLIGKCAEGVAQFMYELVCHYGAARIHISDQGRAFVNQVCIFLCIQSLYMYLIVVYAQEILLMLSHVCPRIFINVISCTPKNFYKCYLMYTQELQFIF